MLFSAKLVEDRPAGKIMIGIAVTGIVFIFITMLLPELSDLVPFFLITLLISVGVMTIVAGGNLSNYKLVNDLQIYTDSMQINNIIFPFKEVSNLIFEFQSYEEFEINHKGQKGYTSFGLGNNLSFEYRNQRFHYQFHLRSKQHYIAFIKMLEVLYDQNISFSEKNLNGPTYLMRNINNDQLLLLKRQYGAERNQ